MALMKCPECGKEISSNAQSCPNCGNPMRVEDKNESSGIFCSSCKKNVAPVVTSVGGGSCSFGKRETWKCPRCARVLHRSGCFVATVAYGDEDYVEVLFLRAFRDEVLSKTTVGIITIWVYYRIGPHVARIVEVIPPLKSLCRYVLDKTIDYIEATTRLKRNAFHQPRP